MSREHEVQRADRASLRDERHDQRRAEPGGVEDVGVEEVGAASDDVVDDQRLARPHDAADERRSTLKTTSGRGAVAALVLVHARGVGLELLAVLAEQRQPDAVARHEARDPRARAPGRRACTSTDRATISSIAFCVCSCSISLSVARCACSLLAISRAHSVPIRRVASAARIEHHDPAAHDLDEDDRAGGERLRRAIQATASIAPNATSSPRWPRPERDRSRSFIVAVQAACRPPAPGAAAGRTRAAGAEPSGPAPAASAAIHSLYAACASSVSTTMSP